MRGSGSSDALVVVANDVRKYLSPLLAQRDIAYREATESGEWNSYDGSVADTSHTGSYGVPSKRTPLLTGAQWLAVRTGYDSDYLLRLMSPARGPRHFTLKVADRLLSGAGLSHLLDDGTISVIVNPHWSRARWEAWRDTHCDPDLPDILS